MRTALSILALALVPTIASGAPAETRPAQEASSTTKPAEIRTILPPTREQSAEAIRAATLKQLHVPRAGAHAALVPRPWRPATRKPQGFSTSRTRPDGPLTPEQVRKQASAPPAHAN